MPITVAIPVETCAGERRVALVPADVARLARRSVSVVVQAGAGAAAGFLDEAYVQQGAAIASGRGDVFAQGSVVLQVRAGGAAPPSADDLALYRAGQVVAGFLDPLGAPAGVAALAEREVSALAVELVPRITRAQSMDALSSMANLAGYRAVLLAAVNLPKIFPMMMTAAGTLSPARVFVLGAGVAGLQAIATAKRLGAVVEAYDVRPEVREQVESVGGKFVSLELETGEASGSGGYAKAQSEDFYLQQQALMSGAVQAADVVITTAAVPGRRAPRLVTRPMVEGMRPGSVIVDLAAETGGNCELTRAGETVQHQGVAIIGPTNVPSELAHHASQLLSRNLTALVEHLVTKDGELVLDLDDEITAAALVTHQGEIRSDRVRDALQAAQESSS